MRPDNADTTGVQALKERALRFSLATVRMCRGVRGGVEARVIVSQLIRSATSVAANYQAACRSRSRREFVARIGVAIEECDESVLWIRMLVRLDLLATDRAAAIEREGNELISIFVVSKSTAIRRLKAGSK